MQKTNVPQTHNFQSFVAFSLGAAAAATQAEAEEGNNIFAAAAATAKLCPLLPSF